jgi:hypothetical protein
MFWIGLIVGIIISVVAFAGYFMWCLYCTQMSFDDFEDFCDVLGDAVWNRESSMQVWHDGELINEMIFEEK